MSKEFLVKVHNRHVKEFVTVMDGVTFKIPGYGFIEVSRTDAMKLKNTYSPIKRDGVGNDLAPRALDLEFPKDADGKTVRYRERGTVSETRSMLDGKDHATTEAFNAHVLANASRLEDIEKALKSMKKV